MNPRIWITMTAFFINIAFCKAQLNVDSSACAKVLKEICYLCKNVDFRDPDVTRLGTFYKLAPYIVYRGEDTKRAWKTPANYKNEEEKKGVDEVGLRINNGINQDSAFTINGYRSETEREGTWHVLTINYMRKGKPKVAYFAFLKINGKFLLGDID